MQSGDFRGGPHRLTRLPINNGLDSHHIPDRRADPSVSVKAGPAIQMIPADHALTSSHGRNDIDGQIYRAETAEMIQNEQYRSAMAREVRDVRNAARLGGGDITRYNKALAEMLKYARQSGQLPINARTGK